MVVQTSGLGNEFPAGADWTSNRFQSQEDNTQQLKIRPLSQLNGVTQGFMVLANSNKFGQLNNEFNQLFE